MLRSASQSDTGFMIYSAMLSMGSCIGYLLSAVDWQALSQTTLCSSEQTAIVIVLILFILSLIVTLWTAKERPLKTSLLSHGSPMLNGDAKVPLDEVLAEKSESRSIKKLITNSFQLTFIMACIIKVSIRS